MNSQAVWCWVGTCVSAVWVMTGVEMVQHPSARSAGEVMVGILRGMVG